MSIHRQSAMDADSSVYVLEDGVVNSDYRLGLLAVVVGEEEQSVQVIPIARFNGRHLVAVPLSAWHKTTARRVLPSRCFLKPTTIEVLVVDPNDMDNAVDGLRMRLWVGYLNDEVFDTVDMSLMEFDSDYSFEVNGDTGYLPYAHSLVEVANEVYAFFSAAEDAPAGDGSDGDMPDGDAGLGEVAGRVGRLEQMMQSMHATMEQVSQRLGVGALPQQRVTFSPSLSSSVKLSAPPKSTTTRPGALRKPAATQGGLDPALVAAASQAGVGQETLEEVSRLMSRNVKALKVKDLGSQVQPDPLSDVEEEEPAEGMEGEGYGSEQLSGDPMQQAVLHLTELMKGMTEDKKKRQSSKIENALEYTGSSSTESSTVGLGKRSAAARRALRQMLQEQPEEIFALLERLMMEDLMSQTLGPGMPAHALSSRAWVEHRSRIGAFKTSAHCAWATAGALDCLARGQVHAARARLIILLLQLDQAACDRGNWTLAAELSLEHPPHLGSLLQHNPPSEGEPPYSRLLDPRWGEIALAHLKEQDEFLTKRRGLGKPVKKDDAEDEKDSPRRKPKPKSKAKASPEGDV